MTQFIRVFLQMLKENLFLRKEKGQWKHLPLVHHAGVESELSYLSYPRGGEGALTSALGRAGSEADRGWHGCPRCRRRLAVPAQRVATAERASLHGERRSEGLRAGPGRAPAPGLGPSHSPAAFTRGQALLGPLPREGN